MDIEKGKGRNLTADNKRIIENLDFVCISPRKGVLQYLEADLRSQKYDKQILLSFIGDVYCENTDNSQTTREALKLFHQYHAPVAVLSKGGERMLKDIDIFKEFGKSISVGTTLTFFDESKSKDWEPGAALPAERCKVLKEIHNHGVKTFASFEPVIEPSESLKLIEKTLEDDSVDHYKIGKLNNYKGLDKGIDWHSFLRDALALIRPANKQIYVKEDLRAIASEIKLYEDEVDPERYIVKV